MNPSAAKPSPDESSAEVFKLYGESQEVMGDVPPLSALPDAVAQPILEREARIAARASRERRPSPRFQQARRFASFIGQLNRRHK
jgi:hypothetical protein